jgi:hypothetical protein
MRDLLFFLSAHVVNAALLERGSVPGSPERTLRRLRHRMRPTFASACRRTVRPEQRLPPALDRHGLPPRQPDLVRVPRVDVVFRVPAVIVLSVMPA